MWRGTFVQVNQKPRVQFSVVVLWQSWEYCEAAIAKLSEKNQVFFWKWWWENELLPDQKNYPILGLPALGHWFWPIPGCSSLCRATRRKGFDCWCLSDATWTSFVMVVFQINHVHPSSFWKLYNSSVNMNKYILTKAIYISFNSAQKCLLFLDVPTLNIKDWKTGNPRCVGKVGKQERPSARIGVYPSEKLREDLGISGKCLGGTSKDMLWHLVMPLGRQKEHFVCSSRTNRVAPRKTPASIKEFWLLPGSACKTLHFFLIAWLPWGNPWEWISTRHRSVLCSHCSWNCFAVTACLCHLTLMLSHCNYQQLRAEGSNANSTEVSNYLKEKKKNNSNQNFPRPTNK